MIIGNNGNDSTENGLHILLDKIMNTRVGRQPLQPTFGIDLEENIDDILSGSLLNEYIINAISPYVKNIYSINIKKIGSEYDIDVVLR